MEFSFLAVMLISALVGIFTRSSTCATDRDWDDVMVTTVGRPTTLACVHKIDRGAVTVNWRRRALGKDEWNLILTATEGTTFSGSAHRPPMRLVDGNFQNSGVFSLFFIPVVEDQAFYSCQIMQESTHVKDRIILLAILTVTIVPSPTIPHNSILRLIADVKPAFAINRITWKGPGNVSMRSEAMRNTGTVAKLPRASVADNGEYLCIVQPRGNSSKPLFAFNVGFTIDSEWNGRSDKDDDNVAKFVMTRVSHIYTATVAESPFQLSCPVVQGDYVLLYWKPPDGRKGAKRVYLYDRWRGSKEADVGGALRLAGPPYNPQTGSFAFLVTPQVRDGGEYTCEVFLNENVFSQTTTLSVLKVVESRMGVHSGLDLKCLYSQRSQVTRTSWTSSDPRHLLKPWTTAPGMIGITLPLPITADTAGNYTCTLQLSNGQTVWAVHTVLPSQLEGEVQSVDSTPSPLLPFLSVLLLLVPLVAAAVGVLLWRQGHISRRGIEQSLSHHSGEVENIYENPDDIRQASPQGSVYMDLKPTGPDDVYKELDRCEKCQG